MGEVLIETAGTMDRDVELKFRLGDSVFSIDVKKQFLEQVKDIYKALIAIGRQQVRDMGGRENAVRTLDALGGMLKLDNLANEAAVVAHYDAILGALNDATQVRHHTKDFSDVFERYIHNGAPPPRVAAPSAG